MKKLALLALCMSFGGCSSNNFDNDLHTFKQTLTEAQAEISRIQTIGFCGDDPRLKSYIETKRTYSFTCYDGRSFMLYKTQ